MSELINWEGSPKNGFARRRLERCYNLNIEDLESERSEVPTKEEPTMGVKRRPHREPYWNFWRAVFAGWMIRYPKQIFQMVGIVLLIPVLGLLTMCSTPTEIPNNDTQSTQR